MFRKRFILPREYLNTLIDQERRTVKETRLGTFDKRTFLSRLSFNRPHDDLPALGVVDVDSHPGHVLGALDAERLVDLVLDGEAVGVPAETALDVEAVLVHPSEECKVRN